eukprot:TRINITY_DN21806_c0_g1_i1.p1 TRINITY_DN21806_c0_g1~~TRINITY_DN21806_c0_g1_i1.p1  ORF type:complete len:392 (+),score=63.24 TRINITY_DN21806_c0_g1_i1:70-1176(+)
MSGSDLEHHCAGSATAVASTFEKLMEWNLSAHPVYARAVENHRLEFFEKHVRLVYGGAARNNAELFLPAEIGGGKATWLKRPTYKQILEHGILDVLRKNPGVGLIFVRQNNHECGGEVGVVTGKMKVSVFDRAGNVGVITTWIEEGDLMHRYDVAKSRDDGVPNADPLGYGLLAGRTGEYFQWNTWCREYCTPTINAVGTVGAHLYTHNPCIGDVTVMHREGWNFGDNGGGHGGVGVREKTPMMLLVDPLGSAGSLGSSKLVAGKSEREPSLLDVGPTVLERLGVSKEEFGRFATNDFSGYLQKWLRNQPKDILEGLTDESLGVPLSELTPIVDSLLSFIILEDKDIPKIRRGYKMYGSALRHSLAKK